MKDGAALIQPEAGGVLAEVLGHGAAQGVQLPDQSLHLGQLGPGPLREERIRQKLQQELLGRGGWGFTRRKTSMSLRKAAGRPLGTFSRSTFWTSV